MLTCYKFFIAFMLLVGITLLAVNPILGVVVIIFAIALFGSQRQREQRREDERRHQEMVAAMQGRKSKE